MSLYKTESLVRFGCRLLNVSGPFQLLCHSESQVFCFRYYCEDFIVELVATVVFGFSDVHDLTFFRVEAHSPTLAPTVECI